MRTKSPDVVFHLVFLALLIVAVDSTSNHTTDFEPLSISKDDLEMILENIDQLPSAKDLSDDTITKLKTLVESETFTLESLDALVGAEQKEVIFKMLSEYRKQPNPEVGSSDIEEGFNIDAGSFSNNDRRLIIDKIDELPKNLFSAKELTQLKKLIESSSGTIDSNVLDAFSNEQKNAIIEMYMTYEKQKNNDGGAAQICVGASVFPVMLVWILLL